MSLPGTAALRQSLPSALVGFVWSESGQVLASSLLVAGEHVAEGGSLSSGVSLCLEPPKTHPQQVWRGMSPTNAKEGDGGDGMDIGMWCVFCHGS